MTRVTIRVVVRDAVQVFERDLTGDRDVAIRDLVDYFEGQIGTVLSIYQGDQRLYKGLAEAWELGVR